MSRGDAARAVGGTPSGGRRAEEGVALGIPVVYNLRSLRRRWASAAVAVLGIAGAVGVLVSVLALARGFRATLVSSGLPENVIVQRAGAESEMTSVVLVDDVRAIGDRPEVAVREGRPLVSPEVVVIGAFPLRRGGGDANVQIRGVSPGVLDVRQNVRVSGGRFLRPGLHELVVGRGARAAYAGLEVGGVVRFGGAEWAVVGEIESGGSAFDSELWADADVLAAAYKRPAGVYQSLTARLTDAGAFEELQAGLAGDRRLQVHAMRERDYYAKQSQAVTLLITGIGSLVAAVMALGAVFGALNTMYAAVSQRTREIAVLRALGFGEGRVVASFLVESLLVALAGGVLGCLAALPVNGITTGTLNFQTFSHLAFAFRVTPDLLAGGLLFALVMGVLGGLPPALRAAHGDVAGTLRGL
jgi:putative ABC transport system permease protein